MFKSVFRAIPTAARATRFGANCNTIANNGLTRFYSQAASLNKSDVTTRIANVIKAFDKSHASASITEQTMFHKDLGLDSLDTVELLVAIEEEFDIEIPDKVADELKSVGETADYIVKNPDAN